MLGSDEDFWLQGRHRPGPDDDARAARTTRCAATSTTSRCFLGRNGRISVFGSERALARYLADEHDHDLSGLATYDDIRTAATDGSLRVEVTDDNVYVLTGIVDDLADGPDARGPRPAGTRRRIAQGRRRLRRGHDRRRRRSTPISRSAGSSRTCWIPTRSASTERHRTPRPSSSGRRWRPSSSRGCAPRIAFAGGSADQHREPRFDHLVDDRQPLVERDERRLHRVDGEPLRDRSSRSRTPRPGAASPGSSWCRSSAGCRC